MELNEVTRFQDGYQDEGQAVVPLYTNVLNTKEDTSNDADIHLLLLDSKEEEEECDVPVEDAACGVKTTLESTDKLDTEILNSGEEPKSKPAADEPQTEDTLCEICQQEEAVYICKECPPLMCSTCRNKHGEFIKEYKDHTTYELCLKHKDGITHLCAECVHPLCVRCMYHDHKEHAQYFIEINKGIEQLRNKAQILHQKINKQIIVLNKDTEKNKVKYKRLDELRNGLKEHKSLFESKVKEVEKFLEDVESSEEHFKEIQKHQALNVSKCSVAAASLNTITKDVLGFCKKYRNLVRKAEETMENCTSVLYTPPPFTMAGPHEIVKETNIKEIKNLKVKKTVISINKSDEIGCRWQLCFIEDDVLSPSHSKPYHVIRLNNKGKVTARYYPQSTGDAILGVAVYDKNIYMLQSKTITKITQEKSFIYNPDVKSMIQMLVKDDFNIFITQYSTGSIFMYNTYEDTTEVVIRGLNKPTYMSLAYTPEGYRYLVTEEGAHCVHVYSDTWQILHTIGGIGILNTPSATTVTDMGTLLIADQGNHRISHYSLEGQFLSHVVTKDDGLEYPVGICYKHPYLWVSRSFSEYLKCFELRKQ